MPIFELPAELTEVGHFTMPCVKTWGGSADAEYKVQVCHTSRIHPEDAKRFEGFVFWFCIRCVVARSRDKPGQVPDVENIPKLIVDAFTGLLYPDDDLHHVRGVQVEAEWGPDEQERTEVWIYGLPEAELTSVGV
ncbi:MAG: RusA family crossover junction endodeoxyribonuclease [Anaerolineae bacterium]|nr:RusA family crossover junction endodeoxyribonuclease [Anaerolineae bacterium]